MSLPLMRTIFRLRSSSNLKMGSEAMFRCGSKHSWMVDISVIASRLPAIPCSNCAGSGLATGSSEWRRADAWRKRTLKPQLLAHAGFTSLTPTHTQASITHSRVNQPFNKPLWRSLIPQPLTSGSRQYLVSHRAMLWSGSVGPACPALSMHGSPQLSFYFRSMDAYLSPAGASETMDMLPYPNTGL